MARRIWRWPTLYLQCNLKLPDLLDFGSTPRSPRRYGSGHLTSWGGGDVKTWISLVQHLAVGRHGLESRSGTASEQVKRYELDFQAPRTAICPTLVGSASHLGHDLNDLLKVWCNPPRESNAVRINELMLNVTAGRFVVGRINGDRKNFDFL
jgi:hypothetical protein